MPASWTSTTDYGAFDYIIAHGVYSWVPADVRDKMLAIFHDNMRPQGVAFVSYNAYPGSHLRDLVRDMMLFHVRDIADPRERVAQARAVVKALSRGECENLSARRRAAFRAGAHRRYGRRHPVP